MLTSPICTGLSRLSGSSSTQCSVSGTAEVICHQAPIVPVLVPVPVVGGAGVGVVVPLPLFLFLLPLPVFPA